MHLFRWLRVRSLLAAAGYRGTIDDAMTFLALDEAVGTARTLFDTTAQPTAVAFSSTGAIRVACYSRPASCRQRERVDRRGHARDAGSTGLGARERSAEPPLAVAGVTSRSDGNVTPNGHGSVTYTPNVAFAGSDTFSNGYNTTAAAVNASVARAVPPHAGNVSANTAAGAAVMDGYTMAA